MKTKDIMEYVEKGDVLFFNFVDQNNLYSKPMTVHDCVDGNIYLLTSRNSELYHLLDAITIVNLTMKKDNTYLVIKGKYSWSQDKDLIDKYWDEMAERILKVPEDDSSVSVIQFKVDSFRYWENATDEVKA